MSCIYLNAQTQRVSKTNQLQDLGYSIGTPLFVGNIHGVKMYRAPFAGDGFKMKPNGRCVKGVGCCAKGFVDFDETGTIHFFRAKLGEVCDNGKDVNGQMYYNNEGEIWIE